MPNDELKDYIKKMLGEDYVEVELTEETLNTIVKQALDKVAPYYDGRRYILGTGPIVDLSDHTGIKEIINVYNCHNSDIYTMQEYVFGGDGIMIYSSRIMDRLELFTCYRMLYNELQYDNGINFRWIKPNLYLDGYNYEVIIEALVRPEALSDIDPASEYYAWVKDYALALAKEAVGRIRSKFTTEGSPYQLDGNTLLNEAIARKQELEANLIGSIFIL